MGNARYSMDDRKVRATASSYFTASTADTFAQSKVGRAHESMIPAGVTIRESRDSEKNPLTMPIILALDVTGSMGRIPAHLVKDGLPTMMSRLIQAGTMDPALMFMAIGDHQVDSYPLQIGQFESGDEELDTWLTRTYLEGGGGANQGESYLLAWYFAAFHTATDAWDKRGQKGFLFTVGDEPCLPHLPENVIRHLMGNTPQTGYDSQKLLELAQQRWNVYHLHILQGNAGKYSEQEWKDRLGQNCVSITNSDDVPKVLAEIVRENTLTTSVRTQPAPTTREEPPKKDEEMML